jgi:hypothetical protein
MSELHSAYKRWLGEIASKQGSDALWESLVEEFAGREVSIRYGSPADPKGAKLAERIVLLAAARSAYSAELESNKGDVDLAWRHAADANYWRGIVLGMDVGRNYGGTTIVELARKAANIRHAPARARKAQIQDWYSENHSKYRSMDQAAEAAATLFGVAFRTARDHIGEVRKRERAARKV